MTMNKTSAMICACVVFAVANMASAGMSQKVQPGDLKQDLGKGKQIFLQMRLLEIDAEELPKLGLGFPESNPNAAPDTDSSDEPTDSSVSLPHCLIVDRDAQLLQTVAALQQDGLAKVVAMPKLVTLSGRQATLEVGADIPVARRKPGDTSPIEIQRVGNRVEVLPTLLDNDTILIGISCRTSHLTRRQPADQAVKPALRTHTTDAGIELTAGQTCVLCSLIEKRPNAADKSSGGDDKTATKDIVTLLLVTPDVNPKPIRGGKAAGQHPLDR